MRVELRNDFHNKTVRMNLKPGIPATRSQIKKAHHSLCGMKDCWCGGICAVKDERITKEIASDEEGEYYTIRINENHSFR